MSTYAVARPESIQLKKGEEIEEAYSSASISCVMDFPLARLNDLWLTQTAGVQHPFHESEHWTRLCLDT